MQTVWLFGATLGLIYALVPTLLLLLWIYKTRRDASLLETARVEDLTPLARIRFLVTFLLPFLVIESISLLLTVGMNTEFIPVLVLMIGLHQLEAVTVMYAALIFLDRYSAADSNESDCKNEA
jgi:hypothetical protein